MVCSVGTVGSDGVVTVIPFRNVYAATNAAWTSELAQLLASVTNWVWKVTIVIGTDRNMFFISFMPDGDTLATTHYGIEVTSNEFFTDATDSLPANMKFTASTAFNVDALTTADYKIGA